jgi:hypothetical protein
MAATIKISLRHHTKCVQSVGTVPCLCNCNIRYNRQTGEACSLHNMFWNVPSNLRVFISAVQIYCMRRRHWARLSGKVKVADCRQKSTLSIEYAGHGRTGIYPSFQELCTDPSDIMLTHTRGDGGR